MDLGGENCCRAGSAIIYSADGAINGLSVAVRFAADRKLAVPPTAALCASGATVIAELSDGPMSVQSRRETLAALEVDTQRLHCAAVSAAPGRGESTTDKSYYGLCAVVDDGETLAVSESGSGMAASEIDVFNLCSARAREHTYEACPGRACMAIHAGSWSRRTPRSRGA